MTEVCNPKEHFANYGVRLAAVLANADFTPVETLARALLACWRAGKSVYFCGNGGSAGNAIHLANDFIYGIAGGKGPGMRAHALSANSAVLTCLANDIEFAEIYSTQIKVFCGPGDVLIALSGSGNSPNILKAIEAARDMGMTTFAILGFSGGKAKALVETPIHFAIDDMQISEDLQMMVGHMVMQWLKQNACQGE